MTDPGDPQSQSSQSSPPSPFNPRPLGPRPGGGGCSKPALLGCGGALVLLVGILLVVFAFKAQDFLRWTFRQFEAQVTTQLPPDLPAADRQRLHAAFAAADRSLASGKLDSTGLQKVQQQLVQFGSKPNRQLTREDVLELTVALERMAGKTPAPPPAEPPSPTAPSSPPGPPTSPAPPASPTS